MVFIESNAPSINMTGTILEKSFWSTWKLGSLPFTFFNVGNNFLEAFYNIVLGEGVTTDEKDVSIQIQNSIVSFSTLLSMIVAWPCEAN